MISFGSFGWNGLGNQLFQYSALLGIAEKTNVEVRTGPYQNHLIGKLFEPTVSPLTNKEAKKIRHRYIDHRLGYNESLYLLPPFTDIDGLFQSQKYFPSESLLRNELTFRKSSLQISDDYIHSLRVRGLPLVALTIRRGDYLHDTKQFLPLWDSSYYQQSFQQLQNEIGQFTLLISSDDPVWCRENYLKVLGLEKDPGDDNPILIVEGINDLQQFCILSKCDHYILANSTYSWWFAWLGATESSHVLVPQTWFGSNVQYPDSEREKPPTIWQEIPTGFE